MRLLPRSLFGRIVLILAGGFLAIQLITTAIAISDRSALVFRSGANQAATRIGDVVRALMAASPVERS
ncbi:MAG: two-component sensor histidine kinase, partial [Burkholderiales bacterium]